MNDTVVSERDLIVRAIRMAKAAHTQLVADGRTFPVPLWYLVKGVFGRKSTVSEEICRAYGLDPDEQVGEKK